MSDVEQFLHQLNFAQRQPIRKFGCSDMDGNDDYRSSCDTFWHKLQTYSPDKMITEGLMLAFIHSFKLLVRPPKKICNCVLRSLNTVKCTIGYNENFMVNNKLSNIFYVVGIFVCISVCEFFNISIVF